MKQRTKRIIMWALILGGAYFALRKAKQAPAASLPAPAQRGGMTVSGGVDVRRY